MHRHTLCASVCALTLALSPALAIGQAPQPAPKSAPPKAAPAKPAPTKAPPGQTAATKAGAKKGAPGAVKTVTITGTDNMRYAPSTIRVKAGEKVVVSLKSVSALPKMAMAHNFVLLKAGTDQQAFATASATARETDFIAPKLKAQVLAATPLAGGGETVTTEFTAPTAPGKYAFICTFPGHFQSGMVGVLIVE